MPRKILNSNAKRKVQLQEKRAVKRGELDAEVLKAKHRDRRQPSQAHKRTSTTTGSDRLKSVFADVPNEYLVKTRNLAFSLPLKRPLDGEDAKFPLELLTERDVEGKLRCPERPKFKFGISKKELERNEEGVFRKWKEGVEEVMRDWMASGSKSVEAEPNAALEDGAVDKEAPAPEETDTEWPRGPSWFEANLEVWRQLWRVTESSSILLLLLDARCVPLHCPPSLRTYLQRLTPKKEFILVLTKADLVNPTALEGWKTWIKTWWGDAAVQVVSVMSYDTEALYAPGRAVHRPEIPEDSLDELIVALKTAHKRLQTPPEAVSADPARLKKWRPRVRSSVDWEDLLRTRHFAKPKHTKTKRVSDVDVDEEEEEAEGAMAEDVEFEEREDEEVKEVTDPLTIGLIGQPNVGKSSLLNALLGQQRVRASRTPGKTKYRQTMFWGEKKEILFADSPGLVCPSLVGVELQVLAGILPISQIPSLPACIYFAASHLPVETIFNVPVPTDWTADDTVQSNKTYRAGFERSTEAIEDEERRRKEERSWTAGLIMEGRALDRGYLTAKGGRPDANRAANGMMRLLADGKIRWCFWPPDAKDLEDRKDVGIWIGDYVPEGDEDDSHEESSDHDGAETGEHTVIEEEDEDEDDDDDEAEVEEVKATSFFAALDVEDEDDDDEEDDEDEEETEVSDREGS